MLKTSLAFLLFVLSTTPRLEAQSSWLVNSSAAPGGNGSVSQPFQTIMDAVNAAVSGDYVYLYPGIYNGGDVDLGQKNLTISSFVGASTVTIVNTPGSLGRFKVDGPATGTTTLINLTFSGFSGYYLSPEAVLLQNTQVNILGCVFLNSTVGGTPDVGPNTPAPGLFIDGCVFDNSNLTCDYLSYASGTTGTIINSLFKVTPNLSAQESVVAYSQILLDSCHFQGSSTILVYADGGTITNCLFEDNPSGPWSLETWGSNILVSSSTFSRCQYAIAWTGLSQIIETSSFEGCSLGIGNQTYGNSIIRDCSFRYLPQGTGPFFTNQSGIQSSQSALTVDRCSFRGLQGVLGSAIYTSGPLTLTNSSIQDCHAQLAGGAVFVDQSNFDINNCSFVDNTASLDSTLHFVPGSSGGVKNSIIRGNSAQHISGQTSLTYCNVEGGWSGPGSENFDLDPLFVDVANGDLHLGSASPCLDAGDYDSLGLTLLDLDSNPRLSGKYVDIGCYESTSLAPTLIGTQEDLQLIAKKNNARINTDSIAVYGGDLISLKIVSPHHGLDGFPIWVMGELFSTGGSPILPAGHPAVHLNLSIADVLFDSSLSTAIPGWTLGLPAIGIDLNGPVPFGLSGSSYRLQVFLLAPIALNSWYAATSAVDLGHQ